MKSKRKSSAAAITLAQVDPLQSFLGQLRQTLFFSLADKAAASKLFTKKWSAKLNFQFDRENPLKFFKNLIPGALLVLVLMVIFFGAKNLLDRSTGKVAGSNSDSRFVLTGPKATKQVDKSFEIPIKDDKGKEVTRVKYILESVELRDEIIVKGERMVAVKGRTFLIMNIKLTNNYDRSIDVNARDYVRITIGKNEEKIAADIHNDPVSVQPMSTKSTRLGFPINDTDKNLTLQLGEISGAKQNLNIKF